jgi:hypothetical protein
MTTHNRVTRKLEDKLEKRKLEDKFEKEKKRKKRKLEDKNAMMTQESNKHSTIKINLICAIITSSKVILLEMPNWPKINGKTLWLILC